MERLHAQRWLGLAILSLVLAGLLSTLLVIGRAPGLAEMMRMSPQLHFFHVDTRWAHC